MLIKLGSTIAFIHNMLPSYVVSLGLYMTQTHFGPIFNAHLGLNTHFEFNFYFFK